jgi:multidrug resistance protein
LIKEKGMFILCHQPADYFALGIFLIGFGVGALVSGPFSETVGRNPIYIATLIFYMLFLMGASLSPNLASQLICRFFSGFFGATPLVCAGGSLSDLWTPEERVFAFPMFACLSFAGPVLGPIFGGLISNNDSMNWRWVEWITLMVSGLVLAIVILFQPETYGPILLKWKVEHLRRLTGDGRYRSAIEIKKMSLAYRLLQSLYRPIVMTAQEPIIILLGLYLTVVYIVLFTFLTGYTFIYMDIYHFSTAMMGLSFLGIVIGIISCAPLIPLNMNLRKRDIARAQALGPGTRVAPESRLYWAMFGAPAIPISLFWMGWTAQASISVWSPLIASALFGFGILCIFISCYQYIIDSYEIYAASALASVTMVRYIVSGVMVEVSIPFYRNMGVAHTLTILGSLSTLLFPIPYALYRYGPLVRKKSKYAFFIDD